AALVQAVRASLAKRAPGEAKIEEELDHADRQIVSLTVVSEGSSTSSPPPVFRRVDLFGHLKFDPPSVRDAFRRVEDLDGNQVSPLVVVEYDARLVLVALGDGHAVAEDDRDDVRPGVVRDLHDCLLQYFTTLLVRYAVTTSAGRRSTSTNIRKSNVRPAASAIRDCNTARPGRNSIRCSGAVSTVWIV